jgi:hypothetical protein
MDSDMIAFLETLKQDSSTAPSDSLALEDMVGETSTAATTTVSTTAAVPLAPTPNEPPSPPTTQAQDAVEEALESHAAASQDWQSLRATAATKKGLRGQTSSVFGLPENLQASRALNRFLCLPRLNPSYFCR